MLPILTQSLWRDEAFSVFIAKNSIFQIISLSAQDTSPPLYYILLHFWMALFGNGELALRTMSLLFHLSTAITIFFIAKKLIHSTHAGILISLVTFLNPFLLQYAFEARTYSLLAFLSVLALFLMMLKKYILVSITLVLAVFAHNFAILTFLAFAGWWLFMNRVKLQLYIFLQLAIFPLIAILLWGGIVWMQWTKVVHGFWIPKPTLSTLTNSFKIFSSGEFSYPIKDALYLFSLAIFTCASIAWVIKKGKNKDSHMFLFIFLLAFIPILITFLFSLFFTPIYYERYLISTVPMIILFVSHLLRRIYLINSSGIKLILKGFTTIYIILLVISSMQLTSKSTKPPISSGIKEILSQAKNNDIIVPESILNFLEVKHYVERSGKNILVYTHSPTGKVPFYIGGVLYQPQDIIKEMPKDKRVWQIKPNGQYKLLNL